MIGMKLSQAKSFFFDRKAVTSRVDKSTARVLSKMGAFVRTRAKGSIRKRKKISDPGSPPSSHAGHLKNFIYFAYEPQRESVVVGPTLFGGAKSAGKAPGLLEFGGTDVITGRKRGGQVAIYRPRPFMKPAMDAELPKFPELWKNTVKK
jgi:hypothetical protein